MQKYVLITAGGKGVRMQSDKPKQFLDLSGRPVLLRTFDAFLAYAPDIYFVLVLPETFHAYWFKLCETFGFHTQCKLADSGPTRFHSVKNGLKLVPDNVLLAIHDGVRPLVSRETISRVFNYAEKFGNAIPVVGVNQSVRISEHALSSALPREKIKLVQTPQCFRSEIIKRAYNQSFRTNYTDDASVVESEGERLYLVDGNHENIKITTPLDLRVAEALLENQTGSAS